MTRAVPRSVYGPTKGELDPETALRSVLALSPADQAREVLAALSASKAQLAKILGVSRSTLYDWLNDREPNAENTRRLATLLRLLVEAGVTGAGPLHPGLLRHAPNGDSPSLLEVLCAEPIDEQLASALLQEIKTLAVVRDPTSAAVDSLAADARPSVEEVPLEVSESGPESEEHPWSAVRRAATSVTDAALWRKELARTVHEATRARFSVVVTCSPNDPFSSHSFVEPQEFAPLIAEIQTRYLVRVERGGDAMAHQACGLAYAPLLDAKNVALAAQLRQEVLVPAGVHGMLNVFLGDAREGVLGWIALGLPVPCEEALRVHAGPLGEIATRASRTLASAVALGRGCGLVVQALPPLTPRERQIVSLLLDGYSDANIAAQLQLSEETVGTHLRRIYRKLGVHSRLELSARLRS